MLTTIVHRIAAAGLFALMLVASSHSTARADWTVTSSCVGTWGMGTCAVNKRHFPRDPHIRQVQTVDNEREVQVVLNGLKGTKSTSQA